MTRTKRRITLTRVLFVACLGIAFTASSGCAVLDKCALVLPTEAAEPVHHLEIDFRPTLTMEEDTAHPGTTVPCLRGRVYLMTEDGSRMTTARGFIGVEVYDTTTLTPGNTAERIAVWKLEPAALKQVERNDWIGKGYSLFLPFHVYNPSVKKVLVRVVYVNEKGEGLVKQLPLQLRIEEEAPQVVVENRRNVPATVLPRVGNPR
jgi:hypothetical protein